MLEWRRHAIYETAEAAVPGGHPEDRLYLWLGPDRLGVEITSGSPGAADEVARNLAGALGEPAEGPAFSSRGGEMLEAAGEVAIVAAWAFPAADRERVRAAVQRALVAAGGRPGARRGR
jgi:hypothetical protein